MNFLKLLIILSTGDHSMFNSDSSIDTSKKPCAKCQKKNRENRSWRPSCEKIQCGSGYIDGSCPFPDEQSMIVLEKKETI